MLEGVLADATPDTFRPHAHSAFRLDDGAEVTLSEITLYNPHPEGGRDQPFSLVFEGPADRTIGQGIHRLTHDVIGEVELFLVPIGPGRYEAVFN